MHLTKHGYSAPRLLRHRSGRRLAVALGATILALGGCTGGADRASEPPPELVWPLPPEQPRIKYVRSISSKEDIGAKEKKSIAATLLGEEEEATVERIRKPYGVHADKSGRIFVADTGWGKLLVFDAANKKFDIWGITGPAALAQPLGVTSDSAGRIYVTDGAQQRVVVFDPNGDFLFAAGRKGELERPAGIVVNETLGRIYVADVKRHHIAVFDLEGNLVSTMGERGAEPGQFNFLTNLAIDRVGNLYVMDTMNFRVQILDPDGNPLKTFGEIGDTPGSFARPKGIGVDPDGHIYVVDAAFNNFQIFDPDGNLLLYVGAVGREPGQFWLPAGAHVDAQGRIYVADQYNWRVQVFQYLGGPSEQPASASAESPGQ